MRRSRAEALHSATRAATTVSVVFVLSALAERAAAQRQGPEPGRDEAELAKSQQSPVNEVMNVGIQTNVSMGLGETNENRTLVRLTALLPLEMSRGLRLVVFPLVPLRSLPPAGPGEDRENGVSDVIVRHYLTPSGPRWRWGIGPIFQLPTATNGVTGTGKLSLGPTAILAYRGEVWTFSFVVEHLHSVHGVTSRRDVDLTALLPSVAYTFGNGLNLGLTSEAYLDWRAAGAARWLVPVLATVSKVTDVGRVPVSMLLGAGPFVAAPPNGPDWVVRFAMALLFPLAKTEAGAAPSGP